MSPLGLAVEGPPLRRKSKPSSTDGSRGRTRMPAVLGFAIIAAQRFGVGSSGGGDYPLVSAVLFFTVAWAIFSGRARVRPAALLAYTVLTILAITSTLVSSSTGSAGVSLPSLVLFLSTYVVILTGDTFRGGGTGFFVGAVWAIKLGSLMAVAQYVIQRLGRGFFDPIRSLPEAWLRPGFNSYYEFQFQGGVSGQFKPNGVIFLEPSFLSLYAGLALSYLVGQAVQHPESRRKWDAVWGMVLVAAFAVSASASGVVVLGTAIPVLVLTTRRNRRMLVAVIAALVPAWYLGVFDLVIGKASEGVTGTTSTAMRLTLPYETLFPYWLDAPLLGNGPGAASRLIAVAASEGGVQTSTSMKLLTEYGLTTTLVLAVVIWVLLRRSVAPAYLITSVLAAWAIPAEALVNATLVSLLLFALPNWGEGRMSYKDSGNLESQTCEVAGSTGRSA